IVEAKKLTLGPQNALTQAERYAKGVAGSPFDFGGYRVPFLYSTNGEAVWFQDARHRLNQSRRVAHFHTPAALQELLAIEKRVAAAAVRVEKMSQAILAKAFRGELVPTEAELARQEGRDYEPTAVLLERIRTERAQANGAAPPSAGRRTRRTK